MEGIGKNVMSAFLGNDEPVVQETKTVTPKEAEQTATTPPPPEPAPENTIIDPEKEPITPGDKENPEAKDTSSPEPKSAEPTPKPEINDDAVLTYFKEKYADKAGELERIDDLFKKPEPQADPFEGISEDVQGFIKYHKETGRGIEDWNKLKIDYSKKSPLELAREKVVEMTGGELKGEDIDGYLEKKLNIDLSDPEQLDKFDLIEIKAFTKDYLAQKEAEKEKYNKPVEKAPEQEMITLNNGQKLPKAEYEKIVEARKTYLDSLKASADKITKADFKVVYDDNGEKKQIELDYDYSKDDVHKMTSLATDLDATLTNLFGTENGVDHKKLQESLFWLDPEGRTKAIDAIVHKALAKRTEELMEELHNPSFKSKPNLPKQNGGKRLAVGGENVKKPGTVQYDFTKI